jgi:hypothetical protein
MDLIFHLTSRPRICGYIIKKFNCFIMTVPSESVRTCLEGLRINFFQSCGRQDSVLLIKKLENLMHMNHLHLRMETEPVSKMLCFLVCRILDDGENSKNPVFFKRIKAWTP